MAGSNGLIWKVALGVFLGGSACLLATCGLLAVGGSAAMQQQEQAKSAAIQDWLAETQKMTDVSNRRYEANNRRLEEQRRIDALNQARMTAPVPLKNDERCVGATRLRRVENGWEQSGSCP